MSMRTDDFDYNLPEELIAQAPAEPRDSCRLLVVDRKGSQAGKPLEHGGTVEHRIFRDIIDYIEPGDVLVSGAVYDLGGGVRPVCARAEIRARTRQELTGQIALTESEKQSAHGARTRWALRVGKKRINFYQNSGISNAECDKITCEYPFAIRGVFALPFSLVRERVQPYRTADAPVSEDAARAALEQALLQQLRETIGADGTILAYETAAEVTGGVLTVTLTAECEQEIGRAQATPDAEFLQLRPPAGEGTTADD